MDFSIIFGNLDIYFEGLKNTMILVSISLFIGLIFAVPLQFSGHQKTACLRPYLGICLLFQGHTPSGSDVSHLLWYGPV